MMNKDADHPWFRPLWARVLVVVFCFGWAVFDLVNQNYGWALVFGGMGAYAIYIFFISWKGGESDGAAAEAEKKDDDTQA